MTRALCVVGVDPLSSPPAHKLCQHQVALRYVKCPNPCDAAVGKPQDLERRAEDRAGPQKLKNTLHERQFIKRVAAIESLSVLILLHIIIARAETRVSM
jgi:hypothetical protein